MNVTIESKRYALALLLSLLGACTATIGNSDDLGSVNGELGFHCGDGECNHNETCASCSEDCGPCRSHHPEACTRDGDATPYSYCQGTTLITVEQYSCVTPTGDVCADSNSTECCPKMGSDCSYDGPSGAGPGCQRNSCQHDSPHCQPVNESLYYQYCDPSGTRVKVYKSYCRRPDGSIDPTLTDCCPKIGSDCSYSGPAGDDIGCQRNECEQEALDCKCTGTTQPHSGEYCQGTTRVTVTTFLCRNADGVCGGSATECCGPPTGDGCTYSGPSGDGIGCQINHCAEHSPHCP